MSEGPVVELSGKWGRIAAWCVFASVVVGGIAGFAGNVLSIRDTVFKFMEGAPQTVQISSRDVVVQYVAELDEGIDITVQTVLDITAQAPVECEAGLLTKLNEYAPRGIILGASRTKAPDYYSDLWFVQGSVVHVRQTGVFGFVFRISPSDFSKDAKFRVECGQVITSWINIEIPDPVKWKK